MRNKRGSSSPGAATPLKMTEQSMSEDTLHKSVAHLLDIALLKPAMWTTFPSGMYELPKSVGGRLKAYGLKEGMPDILTHCNARNVWLELKRRNGTVSQKQKAMHEVLEGAGSVVYVCRCPEAVIEALVREGFPGRLESIKQMLSRPFQPAEKQTTGDLYYGHGVEAAKTSATAQRAQA